MNNRESLCNVDVQFCNEMLEQFELEDKLLTFNDKQWEVMSNMFIEEGYYNDVWIVVKEFMEELVYNEEFINLK